MRVYLHDTTDGDYPITLPQRCIYCNGKATKYLSKTFNLRKYEKHTILNGYIEFNTQKIKKYLDIPYCDEHYNIHKTLTRRINRIQLLCKLLILIVTFSATIYTIHSINFNSFIWGVSISLSLVLWAAIYHKEKKLRKKHSCELSVGLLYFDFRNNEGFIEIDFSNNEYATEFMKLNPNTTKHRRTS